MNLIRVARFVVLQVALLAVLLEFVLSCERRGSVDWSSVDHICCSAWMAYVPYALGLRSEKMSDLPSLRPTATS